MTGGGIIRYKTKQWQRPQEPGFGFVGYAPQAVCVEVHKEGYSHSGILQHCAARSGSRQGYFARQVWRCVNVQLSDMSQSAMGREVNLRLGSNWLGDRDFGRRLMVTRFLYTGCRWACLCRLLDA